MASDGSCPDTADESAKAMTRAARRTAGGVYSRTVLLGSIRARHVDDAVVPPSGDPHAPRITADLAILDERAANIGLDVDGDVFAAVRTGDKELVVHWGSFGVAMLSPSGYHSPPDRGGAARRFPQPD